MLDQELVATGQIFSSDDQSHTTIQGCEADIAFCYRPSQCDATTRVFSCMPISNIPVKVEASAHDYS
eukprot:212507-Amphidinium_carterae.1